MKTLTRVEWSTEPSEHAREAVVILEQITRSASAIRVGVLAEVERSGSWSQDGQRTIEAWMSTRTGSSRSAAYKSVGLSKSLTGDLPGARDALARGLISEDHAQVLARECTTSDSLRDQLADPVRGEAYLLQQAMEMDATRFAKVAKGWAVEFDPAGADRSWRKDAAKEELTLTSTEQGCRINGWLTPANGALLTEALTSHMGRKAADDTRTYPERQAAGLLAMVHQGLNSGLQLPHARVRPPVDDHAGLHHAASPRRRHGTVRSCCLWRRRRAGGPRGLGPELAAG